MIKVYPPHQDKGGKIHSRLIESSQVDEWLSRGWVLNYEQSIGEKQDVVQEVEDKEEVEVLAEQPKRRGRPKKED